MRANVPIARGGRPLDGGAAAVEFALLLPLFVMLVFGIISGGFTFDRWISVTQSAREASRFAATYPVDPSNMNQWYLDVANTAAEGAGITIGTTDPTTYFICVAFRRSTTETAVAPLDGLATYGTLATASGNCNGSTVDENRVEVLIKRSSTFDWVLGGSTLAVTGSNTSRYEPRLA